MTMDRNVEKYYLADRKKYPGSKAVHTLNAARGRVTLERLIDAGLVRIRLEADEWMTLEDMEGDCFNDDHAGTVPGGLRTIESQRKAYHALLERNGVWGVIADIRTHPDAAWIEHVGSVWGVDRADHDSDIDMASHTGVGDEAVAHLMDALRARCSECRRSH